MANPLPSKQEFLRTGLIATAEIPEGSEKCHICFDKLTDIVGLPCHKTHIYDRKCITEWFDMSESCPICRTQLFDESLDSDQQYDEVPIPAPPVQVLRQTDRFARVPMWDRSAALALAVQEARLADHESMILPDRFHRYRYTILFTYWTTNQEPHTALVAASEHAVQFLTSLTETDPPVFGHFRSAERNGQMVDINGRGLINSLNEDFRCKLSAMANLLPSYARILGRGYTPSQQALYDDNVDQLFLWFSCHDGHPFTNVNEIKQFFHGRVYGRMHIAAGRPDLAHLAHLVVDRTDVDVLLDIDVLMEYVAFVSMEHARDVPTATATVAEPAVEIEIAVDPEDQGEPGHRCTLQ